MTTPRAEPDLVDDTFRAVSHPLRRTTFQLFQESDDAVTTVGELAARLAASTDDFVEDEAKAALHHVHLPMLEAGGFVEFDARSGAVRLRASRLAAELLETLQSDPTAAELAAELDVRTAD